MKKIGIIGAGPAGYTAGIYASRGGFEVDLFSGENPGGQLMLTTEVENYPGFSCVQGPDLMTAMETQAVACGCKIFPQTVTKVDFSKRPFTLFTSKEARAYDAIIISTGAQARWLGLESEKKFRGYGVSSCAVCDGGFFRNKEVAVAGGGNTAVEETIFLARQCAKVTLIHRRDTLRAEKLLQKRLFELPNVSFLWDTEVLEIQGQDTPHKHVTQLKLWNKKEGREDLLPCSGFFVAIGHTPSTSLFKDILTLDDHGYIVCDPRSCQTNVPGVFAAGDVMDSTYRQAVTAAGFGCMAALEASHFLEQVG